jgi:hypothetical protein
MKIITTHIFDVGTWVYRDDIPMLDTQIVANDTVHANAAVIQVILSQDNQYSVLPLFSLDKNRIASEEIERFHRIVGQANDRIIVGGGIGNPAKCKCCSIHRKRVNLSHQRVGFLLLLQNCSCGVVGLLSSAFL